MRRQPIGFLTMHTTRMESEPIGGALPTRTSAGNTGKRRLDTRLILPYSGEGRREISFFSIPVSKARRCRREKLST